MVISANLPPHLFADGADVRCLPGVANERNVGGFSWGVGDTRVAACLQAGNDCTEAAGRRLDIREIGRPQFSHQVVVETVRVGEHLPGAMRMPSASAVKNLRRGNPGGQLDQREAPSGSLQRVPAGNARLRLQRSAPLDRQLAAQPAQVAIERTGGHESPRPACESSSLLRVCAYLSISTRACQRLALIQPEPHAGGKNLVQRGAMDDVSVLSQCLTPWPEAPLAKRWVSSSISAMPAARRRRRRDAPGGTPA